MKKQIEIEEDNIVSIAINMLIVATGAINTEVEFRSQCHANLLDKVTRKYLAAVAITLNGLNIDYKHSDTTLEELKKLVLY